MEVIDGEQVATNKKTGAKVVLRDGAWVPYTPKPQPAFQKYFAKPATSALTNILGAMGGQPPEDVNQPNSSESMVARNVVPQTPGQAGRDVGMIAGGELFAPAEGASLAYRALAAPLGRIGITAGTSAIGEKLGGGSAIEGAKEGAIQQTIGEGITGLVNIGSRLSDKALNKLDATRVGTFIKSKILPSITSPLSSARDYDALFRHETAQREIQQQLEPLEDQVRQITTDFQANSPRMLTPFDLDDDLTRIRDAQDIGYGKTGSAAERLEARRARATAHDLTEQLGQKLQSYGVPDDVAAKYMDLRREYGRALTLQKMFGKKGLYLAGDRIDWSKLESLAQEPKELRSDLIRQLGPEGADAFLKSIGRNQIPLGTDEPANLNPLSMLRGYFHPGGVGAGAHIGEMTPGVRLGNVPRRYPRISPTAPAILLGRLKDYLSQGQVTP